MSSLDCDLIQSVIQHMNEDHAAAVLVYVQAYVGEPYADLAKMEDLDRHGMRISYRKEDQAIAVYVPFERPVESADEIRAELVRMAKAGRKLLES